MTADRAALAARLLMHARQLADDWDQETLVTEDFRAAAALLAAPLDRETLARALEGAAGDWMFLYAPGANYAPLPFRPLGFLCDIPIEAWETLADAVLARLAAKEGK